LSDNLSGSVVALDTPWVARVDLDDSPAAKIELFSTGGSLGSVSSTASATFPVPAQMLGVGSHPLYAIVTGTDGAKYRTRTLVRQIIPSFTLSYEDNILSWNSVPGIRYDVLAAPDLAQPFALVGSVTATNATTQWNTGSPEDGARFYRVRAVAP
jgi:hypothetical protein